MYIFLDESGDLGFSEKSSKWFMISVAIVKDKRSLERVVKKVWKSLQKKHKHLNELHASHEKYITRIKILNLLAKVDDLKIMTVILNKDKVYVDLQNQKHYLYTYVANLLLDRAHNEEILGLNEIIDLIVDRKDTNKSLNESFIGHLTGTMNNKKVKNFKIQLHSSHENKSLQAVDFISWAIFQKYEYGNFEFYEIIRNKIVDEKVIFP